MAFGSMISTAVLFPLANVEGPWFRAVTLSIFILSALLSHALHLEPFITFGPFTATAALVLLLVAVLAAGPARTDLIPWLPLFIASLSLVTVVIHDVSQRIAPRPPSFNGDEAGDDDLSGVSTDTWSHRSLGTISTQQRSQSAHESNRLNPIYFARHGPPSRTSQRTGTNVTDITLSGVVAQSRPQWDARTRGYFREAALPGEEHPEGTIPRTASPEGQSNPEGGESNPDLDSDLDSDNGTVASSHPLLKPQGDMSI